MPLFHADLVANQLIPTKPVPFAVEGWGERTHLQRLLREKADAIDPDLMIISEEFSDWEDSARRIDLLGLDRGGNLVVIELKRVEEGSHMELQALRYAAMVSAMDFEGVVHTYEAFLVGQGKQVPEGARQQLERFLNKADPTISTKPRLVLVAPSFSRELTTTVLWLNEQGLNVRCVEANLYKIEGSDYLNIEQVIPLPSASDYQVRIRDKRKAEQLAVEQQRARAQTVEDICGLAEQNGIGPPFRALKDAAERLHLYAYPFRAGRGALVIYTPQENGRQSLILASSTPRVPGKVHLWVDFERFAEFYPSITAAQVAEVLGPQGERNLSPDDLNHFFERLDLLFDRIHATEESVAVRSAQPTIEECIVGAEPN